MTGRPFNPKPGAIANYPGIAGITRPSARQKQHPEPPTLKEWEDALNRRGPASQNDKNELSGGVFPLLADVAGANDGNKAKLQITTAGKAYKLRISVADVATLAALIVNSTGWDLQLELVEGAQGGEFSQPVNIQTFVVPRMRIPVKGKVIALSADSVYAKIFNQSALNPGPVTISAALVEGRVVEDTFSFDNNSGGDAPIAEYSHHFGVSVPGGVVAGDTIQVRRYDGSLLQTFPAREGGLWQVHLQAATVRYVPLAGVVSNLSWTFYRTI